MARNASGTHSLPAGNPVTEGTDIEATWANDTLTDLSAEITDSLSRSGKGGMSAALKAADGTVAAPGLAFNSETGTGFYRSAAGELAASILGTIRAKLTASAFLTDVVQAITATSATIKGAVADGGTAVGVIIDNTIALANATAKLVSFRSNGSEKAYINKDGKGFFVGLDAGSQKLTNLLTPTASTDAATKAYVDGNNPGVATMTGDVDIGVGATNLTGLAITCLDATTYHWTARIYFTSTNHASGVAWGMTGPTVSYTTATDVVRFTNDTSTFGNWIKSNTLTTFTDSPSLGTWATSPVLVLEGWFKTTAAGTFQLTMTGDAYTAKTGSYLEWTAT